MLRNLIFVLLVGSFTCYHTDAIYYGRHYDSVCLATPRCRHLLQVKIALGKIIPELPLFRAPNTYGKEEPTHPKQTEIIGNGPGDNYRPRNYNIRCRQPPCKTPTELLIETELIEFMKTILN